MSDYTIPKAVDFDNMSQKARASIDWTKGIKQPKMPQVWRHPLADEVAYVLENAAGIVDTVFRTWKWTLRQLDGWIRERQASGYRTADMPQQLAEKLRTRPDEQVESMEIELTPGELLVVLLGAGRHAERGNQCDHDSGGRDVHLIAAT